MIPAALEDVTGLTKPKADSKSDLTCFAVAPYRSKDNVPIFNPCQKCQANVKYTRDKKCQSTYSGEPNLECRVPDRFGCVQCPVSTYPLQHWIGASYLKGGSGSGSLYDDAYGSISCGSASKSPAVQTCFPRSTATFNAGEGGVPLSCSTLGIVTSTSTFVGSLTNYAQMSFGCALWKHVICVSGKRTGKTTCTVVKRVSFRYADTCTDFREARKKAPALWWTKMKECKSQGCPEWCDPWKTDIYTFGKPTNPKLEVITDEAALFQKYPALKKLHEKYGSVCHTVAKLS